ncbi:MAG: hypothetical protein K2N52_05385, partial [Clostridia bacterium]|nr:hypothetical protein [Clostridia bacterium]
MKRKIILAGLVAFSALAFACALSACSACTPDNNGGGSEDEIYNGLILRLSEDETHYLVTGVENNYVTEISIPSSYN